MRGPRQLFPLLFLWLWACTPALDWREYRPPEGGFTVLFPQQPGQSERKLATPGGQVTMRMLSVRVGEHVLGAGYADFAVAPDAAVIDAMRDALARNIGGRITADTPVAGPRLSGREIVVAGAIDQGGKTVPAQLRARLLIADKRYYQLVSVGRTGGFAEADIDMFLASFKPN